MEVRTERLSDYVSEPVDFLKLNIEGDELPVLLDAEASGTLRKVREIVVEYHDWATSEQQLATQTELAEALLEPAHMAPHPDCGCGIRAYHSPLDDFSRVDYQAVSGIVTVWGRVQIGPDEMRAERARVEALALYHRWTRRQTDAVRSTAAALGVDLVDLRELEAAASGYGGPPPPVLLD